MKIFFAGPLTNLKDYKKTEAFYLQLAGVVKECGHDYFWAFLNGTDPNVERDHTPQYVYETDTGNLKTSNLMIAYIGEPSTGVGVEIEYANTHNIPVFSSQDDACTQLKEYLVHFVKP